MVLAREKERLEAAAEEAAEATKTVAEVAAAVEHCASPGVPLDEVKVSGGTPASSCWRSHAEALLGAECGAWQGRKRRRHSHGSRPRSRT